ncbi:MAG: SpoIVB peptidase [Bacilli bacterium]|nr:SpoIVB peptidase [Bacilli bacterium]
MRFKRIFITLIISLLLPITTVFSYSQEVYVGGENIGIEVKTKGVLVIGLYKVNNNYIAKESGLDKGDYIVSVNGNNINTISDFTNEINNDPDKNTIDIEYKRGEKKYNTSLNIVKDNNEYKTGLYVKDEVSGIGTLTLIDPANNKYLALGHAVLDSSTNNILDINDGSIYSSYITGINRSSGGNPGEKIGEANPDDKYGTVEHNTDKGIFGTYQKAIENRKLMKVGNPDEIVLGGASILTVVDGNTIREFNINIEKIDKNDELKNILFTITDTELLDKTGGIVQGMSGSPIIQNNKIIGAVTHVIVDDCKKGYGIFITNMLEESEKE